MHGEIPFPIGEIEGGSFTRHTTSARHSGEKPGDKLSEQFPSLTEGGVEKAREAARTKLMEIIENAQQGTVVFIGGKSDQARTGDTGRVYGQELKNISNKKGGFAVITDDEVISAGDRTKSRVDGVVDQINQHKDEKVVVSYPLWIKELSYAHDNRWVYSEGERKGEKTDYFEELVKKYKGSHAESVHDWIENQGRLELPDGRVLQGPPPEKVAREYLHGLSRLQEFAKKLLPDRPVKILGVGHQWDLDAVATFLASGKVDKESFEKVSGGTVINESEMVSDITVSPEGGTSVKYRDKEFEFSGDAS